MTKKTILFICNDSFGKKMAGPAIRCIELALLLAEEFIVFVAGKKHDDTYQMPLAYLSIDSKDFREKIYSSDIIIFQGDALVRFPTILKSKAVLIADMYCPIPLEYQISSHRLPSSVRMMTSWHLAKMMQMQLYVADYFLCASHRQMDFWAGALTISGRFNALAMPTISSSRLERFFGCVPFGIKDEWPSKRGHPLRDKFEIPLDDFVLVWGGGLYEWFDPQTVIRAISFLNKKNVAVHLVFLGVKHPNDNIAEHDIVAETVQLAAELGVLNRLVHFNFGWVDYDTRHEFLMDADVGVSAHLDNVETRYSFRTRMLDYIWCGLPIISTEGDEFGDLLNVKKLGVSTGYRNVEDWVSAIENLKNDLNFYRSCKKSVEMIRSEYTWSKSVLPLKDVCREIEISADRVFIRKKIQSKKMFRFQLFISRFLSIYSRNGISGLFKKSLKKILP